MFTKIEILALLQLLTTIILAMLHGLWHLLGPQVSRRRYAARQVPSQANTEVAPSNPRQIDMDDF
ncbi:hypothetical protein BKA63DRAFT_503057 [Paraphoma chrysanthemicola]|nr:hypothetical protein BKA63DRAFT_503057 [Paraphoma chrysanthemicola]